MNRNGWLALGVLLVGSSAWLVDAMQLSPRAANQERDVERLDALLGGRLALEMGVLEARAGLQSSFDPLNRQLASLRDEIGHLKLQRATSRLENPMKLRETKRDLARVETILRERFHSGKKG